VNNVSTMTPTPSALAELRAEVAHEAAVTRRHLERLPTEHFAWKPHPKSRSAAELALHIVDCFGWVESIFSAPSYDFDPKTYRPASATDTAGLLAVHDATVARALAAMDDAAPEILMRDWSMAIRGRTIFTKRTDDAVRDMTLSHVAHHRGQFSVYERLLDIPVAPSYGPTADG
jgi:uncharacterized damage-inducible protein DinB